jgi:hypothetical protein
MEIDKNDYIFRWNGYLKTCLEKNEKRDVQIIEHLLSKLEIYET